MDSLKTLGGYLVEDGVLTSEQVESILARQKGLSARGSRWYFGEVVIEMGLGTLAQVQHALDQQRRDRRRPDKEG